MFKTDIANESINHIYQIAGLKGITPDEVIKEIIGTYSMGHLEKTKQEYDK